MPKLLFVDDDEEVLDINKKFFAQEGYDIKVAKSAKEAYKMLASYKPDCVLLDVMMPEVDGFQAFEQIKKLSGGAQIIFLTGRISEDDKVDGLLLGADDYIEKPYSLKELSARIKVQLRKKAPVVKASNVLNVPPLKIDIVAHKAFFNSEEIPMSNREYELLYLLAKHPNEIVTFEVIGETFFGSYSENDRRTIMVTASRMRKKIEDYTDLDNVIETVYSKGYLFRTKA